MFSITTIDVNEFIHSVMRANDVSYLIEIERQIDHYMNRNEDWLYHAGYICDMLDIRDTILLRVSQLKRRLRMKEYAHN